MIVIDEAKTLWDYDQRRADELLYRKRHDGVALIVIAQRAKMVPPNARDQCARFFVFRQSLEDAKILAGWHGPGMLDAVELAKGEFIASDGFRLSRHTLDYTVYPPIIK